MWPRQSYRGNLRVSVGRAGGPLAFNVAAAELPRKPVLHPRSKHPQLPAFNVAAAELPRKLANVLVNLLDIALLQCGRGRVTAETRFSSAARPASCSLQCGRGRVTAETYRPTRIDRVA